MSIKYHFVQKPSEDHFCPECTDPLTDPFLIIKCGHHLCGTCRDRLIASWRKECPVCHVPFYLRGTAPNLHMKRQVNSLVVHCEHHKKGCTWTGELRNLQEHLDPARRNCDYVLVTCSFGCGQQVRSGEMKKHKTSICVKRPITCEYCGFHDKRDYVKEKHYPKCLQFPVQCPNKCQVKDLKRGQLQVHKNKCPLQNIACPFSTIGCTIGQLPRQEMHLHMKEEVEQHLLLVVQKIGPLPEPTLPQVSDTPHDVFKVPPVEFTMMDFLHKKTADIDWDSPPFYTHPQGYKMCLNLEPDGYGKGKGTHISLYAALMKGEHDDSLQWPFEGNIVVELMNWRGDKQHVVYNHFLSRCNRVIDSNIGDWYGNNQFISHSSLSYNSATNTEYLQDDCLRLRVKEVAVYSTPLLHKTPSWHLSSQRSWMRRLLNLPQPVCECTVTKFSKRKQFNNIYYSPPFYTHTCGYKMCLQMYANGCGDGKGTHMSLYACLMEGEHDDDLVWPFRGDVTMEVINWREDKEHHQKISHFKSTTHSENTSCCRMYNGAFGDGLGYSQFISHSSLSYNSTTNTEYLQDDCLRLRVKKVVVHSKKH